MCETGPDYGGKDQNERLRFLGRRGATLSPAAFLNSRIRQQDWFEQVSGWRVPPAVPNDADTIVPAVNDAITFELIRQHSLDFEKGLPTVSSAVREVVENARLPEGVPAGKPALHDVLHILQHLVLPVGGMHFKIEHIRLPQDLDFWRHFLGNRSAGGPAENPVGPLLCLVWMDDLFRRVGIPLCGPTQSFESRAMIMVGFEREFDTPGSHQLRVSRYRLRGGLGPDWGPTKDGHAWIDEEFATTRLLEGFQLRVSRV